MLLPIVKGGVAMLAVAVTFLALAPATPNTTGATACANRRRYKAPRCEDDDRCVWQGGGCRDRNADRYSTIKLEAGQSKFCRCILHVMARGGVRNPYAICARSTGTSTGGKPCHYDWRQIPDDEVRAYVGALRKRGVQLGVSRDALKEWYESEKTRV